MIWVLVFLLLCLFAAVQYALLCLKGRWKWLALLPVAIIALLGGFLLVQGRGTTGWGRLEFELELLVFVLPPVMGIALGAAVRGIVALLSRFGDS